MGTTKEVQQLKQQIARMEAEADVCLESWKQMREQYELKIATLEEAVAAVEELGDEN